MLARDLPLQLTLVGLYFRIKIRQDDLPQLILELNQFRHYMGNLETDMHLISTIVGWFCNTFSRFVATERGHCDDPPPFRHVIWKLRLTNVRTKGSFPELLASKVEKFLKKKKYIEKREVGTKRLLDYRYASEKWLNKERIIEMWKMTNFSYKMHNI